MYSNPPLHGALLVSEILKDSELKQQWYKVSPKIVLRPCPVLVVSQPVCDMPNAHCNRHEELRQEYRLACCICGIT